jgi:hypothetical protein
MRYSILLLGVCIVLFSCKKGDGNTPPEIRFKSISDAYFANVSIDLQQDPILTIQFKDLDGDFGLLEKDSAFIFIKNISVTPNLKDSFRFPAAINTLPKSAFRSFVDVQLNLSARSGTGILPPSSAIPATNKLELYFEVYVQDFKKNKSNVIKTEKPFNYLRR